MSWSKGLIGRLFLLIALSFGAGLISACTFTPLYGEQQRAATKFDLAYAEPDSRLEQIVYQDLAFRLGSSTSADAPLVTVKISTGSRRVGRTSSDSPLTTYEMTANANLTITRTFVEPDPEADEGEMVTRVETLYAVSRNASASFTANGQVLADRQAQEEAGERAAHAVADQFRLLIAANLPAVLAKQ